MSSAFPGSAKDATTAFEGGTGDVLLSYENEAIQARAAGADFDYVIPEQTLLIQNPGAVTEDASDAAKAFLDFQLSKEGQTDYAKQGFRPLDDTVKVDVEGANDPAMRSPHPRPCSPSTATSAAGARPTRSTSMRRTGSSPS